MKVIGIIAEYNPFHKGHQYQIEQLREKTGADYCIIAMSGNFLQRGVPALCSKYTRAQMALSCGADLILELPSVWATASAEHFAHGGVRLLENTGVVTHLGFGAETDDLAALQSIASILREEPTSYREALSIFLKQGNSFPTARQEALLAASKLDEQLLRDTAITKDILDNPNNILAIEYLKALPDSIQPILIQRKGAGYHDTDIANSMPSASAIRQALSEMTALADSMPPESYAILQECIQQKACVNTEDFSSILGYRLLSLAKEGYADFADCSPELSNAISNHLNEYIGWDAFCQTLKTKNLTYTRISRALTHILLDIRQSDYEQGKSLGYTPYLKILGFRRDATPLLSAIKQNAAIPLISKAADASALLTADSLAMFEKDIYASDVYNQILSIKQGLPVANDYRTPLVIL